MIRGTSGHVAHQLETVAGVIVRPLYSNKNLFVIDGAPGVWRQVADPKVSDPSELAIVYAAFGGGKISLTFDVLVNAEFELAGFARNVDAAAVPPELSAAVVTAKRRAAENPPTLLTTAAEAAAESERAPEPGAAPRAPRKRAAGSVVTSTTLPSVTEPDGTPLPGSLAEAGLGAASPSGTGRGLSHFGVNDPPQLDNPDVGHPPPGVDADTGFAPAGDEFEI